MAKKGRSRRGGGGSGSAPTNRAVSQFAFKLSGSRTQYALQLFPSDGTNTYSLFPGTAPGMVIRITGLTIDIASGGTPGAAQWQDYNLAMVPCAFVSGALPTTIMTAVDSGLSVNDGTRNSTCFTVGVNGKTRQGVRMATNAEFTNLTAPYITTGDVVVGPLMGVLATTGFSGFVTVSVTYQIGAPRVLSPSAASIGITARVVYHDDDTTESKTKL